MFGRGERQKAARQPDQGLGVEIVGIALVGLVIGDAVVDLRQAGRVRVAEVADLDRRGPGGAREQAAVLGEAGQLDQDVDAVGADQARELGIVERADVAPRAREALQVLGDVVGLGDICVADGLEALAIERREDRRHEVRDRVGPKVRRKIADAQATVRVARAGIRRQQRRDGVAEAPPKARCSRNRSARDSSGS
jgi:hypothetical protein